MSSLLIFTLALLASRRVAAVNDWSTPCFSGTCSYDIAPSNTSAAASLQIWSDAQHAISDVTEAAGWVLLGCGAGNGTGTEQDVRMACMSDAQDACAHLTQGGAEGTVVRLPEGVSFVLFLTEL